MSDLAILGGTPRFPDQLHVGRPNLGDRGRLLARIEDILDRNWLSNDGPLVREFEAAVADLVGVRHCVAMSNGTIALEIAIRAMGMTGEVIVPSFTFVATAHALQWQEITPVFVDVDPVTHNVDPARVEALITPRTTGILATHLWGRPCDTAALERIAERRGLKLLFDAAHAFACGHGGRMVGSFGNAEVFSFHATKFLNSFEGGAVVTDDDDLAERMRFMRNFGFAGYDDVESVGTNGKMMEVAAAMGLTSLESLDDFVAVNHRNHLRYRERLAPVPGITLLPYGESERRNFQYVVLEVDAEEAGLSRDTLMNVLWAEGVLARRYFYPGVHRMEPYRSYFPHAGLVLPQTERLVHRVLSLPTGTAVDETAIDGVVDVIAEAVRRAPELRRRLTAEGLDLPVIR